MHINICGVSILLFEQLQNLKSTGKLNKLNTYLDIDMDNKHSMYI